MRGASKPGPTVLAVDDNQSLLQLITMTFALGNFRVLTASSGPTALEILQREDVDLVLLDLMMPEMDGLTAFRRLREFTAVPVIFLTALGQTEEIRVSLGTSFDDYIVKPFRPSDLLERVTAVLHRVRDGG